MRLQIVSDLHLEFPENKYFLEDHPLQVSGDTLIMAGDIMLLNHVDRQQQRFLDFVADNYEHTYWLPGNHEYYHFDMSDHAGAFQEKIRSNVTLLNNQTITIAGTQLHFSTLWSNITPAAAPAIQRGMNDFKIIKFKGAPLIIAQYNQMHQESLTFLKSAIKPNDIVITHHVPTFQHYPPAYLGSALNQGFATDLDQFILQTQPKYWIYGHHHAPTPDFQIGQTCLITNQMGYVRANEHLTFDPAKIITV